jgi:hypothetical protein
MLPTPSRGWTSSRMRWPRWNTMDVGQISTSTRTGSPGFSQSRCACAW